MEEELIASVALTNTISPKAISKNKNNMKSLSIYLILFKSKATTTSLANYKPFPKHCLVKEISAALFFKARPCQAVC
jgi:hypothetical protein